MALIKCPKCYSQTWEGATVCPWCDHNYTPNKTTELNDKKQVPLPKAVITCPECKRNFSDETSICPHCGYNLTPNKTTELNDKKQITDAIAKHRKRIFLKARMFLKEPLGIAILVLVAIFILILFLIDYLPIVLISVFCFFMIRHWLKKRKVKDDIAEIGEKNRAPLPKAVITCPECKGKFSDRDCICPHCGYNLTPEETRGIKKNLNQTKKRHDILKVSPFIFYIGIIIFAVVIAFIVRELDTQSPEKSPPSPKKSTQSPEKSPPSPKKSTQSPEKSPPFSVSAGDAHSILLATTRNGINTIEVCLNCSFLMTGCYRYKTQLRPGLKVIEFSKCTKDGERFNSYTHKVSKVIIFTLDDKGYPIDGQTWENGDYQPDSLFDN